MALNEGVYELRNYGYEKLQNEFYNLDKGVFLINL